MARADTVRVHLLQVAQLLQPMVEATMLSEAQARARNPSHPIARDGAAEDGGGGYGGGRDYDGPKIVELDSDDDDDDDDSDDGYFDTPRGTRRRYRRRRHATARAGSRASSAQSRCSCSHF